MLNNQRIFISTVTQPLITLLSALLGVVVTAQADFIQTPENCIASEKVPCLVYVSQSTGQQTLHKNFVSFEATAGAQFQINQLKTKDQSIYTLNLFHGRAKFITQIPVVVNGIELVEKTPYFVQKTSDKSLQVLNMNKLELLSYARDPAKNDFSQLVKTEFPAKEKLVKFMAPFYQDKNQLQSDLKSISDTYKVKLQNESNLLQAELKQSQKRAIASSELEEKMKIQKENQMLEDRKKSRALFFMRTFEE